LPSRIESAASTLLALSNSKGVALRSEDSAISSVTNKSVRIAINGLLDDQQAPFGGFKHSGVGREFGTFGIEAYLEPRAILE
jgi:acyl-CoA reductase-like NAD-dependent aldehyde dehydrogenase